MPHEAHLRLATWNIQSCTRGLDDVASFLRSLDADVVALQEVDRGTVRAGGVDQSARLADAAGYPHQVFFRAMDWPGGGEYGLALLARHPILHPRTVPLPTEPGTEQRVLGIAQIALPDGPMVVHVTHLSHRRSEAALRVRQVDQIHRVMDAVTLPRVLAGDLNDLPGSAPWRALALRLADVFSSAGTGDGGTYPLPGGLGALRIDYVFASPDVRPLSARVARTAASDHHALTASVAYKLHARPPVHTAHAPALDDVG